MGGNVWPDTTYSLSWNQFPFIFVFTGTMFQKIYHNFHESNSTNFMKCDEKLYVNNVFSLVTSEGRKNFITNM